MTLRSRLTATYASAILISLLIFAAGSLFAIDRTLRATLDARLSTDARATATLVDVKHGRIEADEEDHQQFSTLIQGGDQIVVRDADGGTILSSQLQPPRALLSLPQETQAYYTVGKGERAVRAFVLPIARDGRTLGTVAVWRPIDWIQETDRGAAIAFGGGAVIIAALAIIAGGVVTRRALDDAFARQRRFTADASHELRAPLSVIRAEADLALRKLRDPQTYRAAMATIAGEADRMEALVENLLAAARAEGGPVSRERVDVAPIVARVADRLSGAAGAKEATITVSSSDGATILADPHVLERAILAVAHNAVKYAPTRGKVALQVCRDTAGVEVFVRDDGPGFSRDALNHALERFWRDDAGRPQNGTGLGLAIAQSIVRAFGGQITLENASGGGAAVRLRFPAA